MGKQERQAGFSFGLARFVIVIPFLLFLSGFPFGVCVVFRLVVGWVIGGLGHAYHTTHTMLYHTYIPCHAMRYTRSREGGRKGRKRPGVVMMMDG